MAAESGSALTRVARLQSVFVSILIGVYSD